MKNTMKKTFVAFAAVGAMMFATTATSGELNPRQSTANLEYGKVLKIRLPYGLCEFDQMVPAYVVDQLSERKDWRRLVEYMLANCPDLGLPLADTATASISEGIEDGSGGSGGLGNPGGDGSTDGGTGSGSSGDDGAGDDSSDDDGNKGHGNDADRHDESNPGNG